MPDIECFQRISVLETNQHELMRAISEHEKREVILNSEINKKLSDIAEQQAKMRSFWGGIVFTVTAFGSGAVLAFNIFIKD